MKNILAASMLSAGLLAGCTGSSPSPESTHARPGIEATAPDKFVRPKPLPEALQTYLRSMPDDHGDFARVLESHYEQQQRILGKSALYYAVEAKVEPMFDPEQHVKVIQYIQRIIAANPKLVMPLYDVTSRKAAGDTHAKLQPVGADASYILLVNPSTINGPEQNAFSVVKDNNPTVSIIEQGPNFEPPYTEACQVTVSVDVKPYKKRGHEEQLLDAVAQEAFCNGIGNAIAYAWTGRSYEEFTNTIASKPLLADRETRTGMYIPFVSKAAYDLITNHQVVPNLNRELIFE